MGKRGWDELISIGSDIAATVTGQPWLAVAGNAVGGEIAGGPKQALLQAGTAFLGNEVLTPALNGVLGTTAGPLASNLVSADLVQPGLARALGLNQAPKPPPLNASPFSGTSGASTGLATVPGGLNVNGSTAPQIAPWTKPQGDPKDQKNVPQVL